MSFHEEDVVGDGFMVFIFSSDILKVISEVLKLIEVTHHYTYSFMNHFVQFF